MPMIAVTTAPATRAKVTVERGPNRSLTHPAGTIHTPYANVDAPYTRPSCVPLHPNSRIRSGPAVDMPIRAK